MRWLVGLVVAFAALVCFLRTSQACENATVREAPAVKQLRNAEEALDDGDVTRARALATGVAEGKVYIPFSMRQDLPARAKRIVALTWIRDPRAAPREIEDATEILRLDLAAQETPDPVRQADLGEAYARAGHDDAAYQLLRSLHEKDLIGSPYAYAALARVAAKRGDRARAEDAVRRCTVIASSPAICHGAYPKPPLLRGKVLGYAFPGVLALVALVRRRRAKHPWSTFADKIFAALVLATAGFVFALAEEPWLTTLGTFAALVLVGLVQRVAFLASVKGNRVSGWSMREPTDDDARLPVVVSFLHSGHRVLEREPDAAYREPARVPTLRISQRSTAARRLAFASVVAIALLGACTTLTFSASRSAPALDPAN